MLSYLAMTPAEIHQAAALPKNIGWMACHFDSSGHGLANIPHQLPAGSILLLDDSQPPRGHSPQFIHQELENAFRTLSFDALILDFQRSGNPETQAMAYSLTEGFPFPVILSSLYAFADIPLLIPPLPADLSLQDYLIPWKGHPIWLELSAERLTLELSSHGAVRHPYSRTSSPLHHDAKLHCHYQISEAPDAVSFHLFRNDEDIHALLQEADALGIAGTIGLFQELGK